MAASARIDWSLRGGIEVLQPGSFSASPPSSSSSDTEVDEVPVATLRPRQHAQSSVATSRPKSVVEDEPDFLWALTEEPHRSRRKAILKAHPEISKLMGYEPLTKYVVIGVVAVQLACAIALRHTPFFSWTFLLTAYVVGGTANQNLFLAIHEITHNLAFRGIRENRVFAMFANLPIGIPYAMLFKRYHIEHHKFLGEDGIDTDLPTRAEMLCLQNVAGKAFFATFQIFFYALRPGFVRSQRFTAWHALNFAIQGGFDYLLVRYFGWQPLLYLVASAFFAGSLHPCAAHFIAEHYVFEQSGQETFSYYGPLNWLTYNVGYHNEHHDFPSVPWTRLPALRKAAAEFYDPLPWHASWPMVTLRFIFDDSVGLFSRVKRPLRSQVALPTPAEVVRNEGGKGVYGGIED